MNLIIFHKYGEELEKRLRLQTFPLAIKLLEKEGDLPEGAIRPKRDLGRHLALCEGFATSRREGTTIAMLKEEYTIVIVTHNMQQAARVSEQTGLFWLGELVEFSLTETMFTVPEKKLTEDYITGRMG